MTIPSELTLTEYAEMMGLTRKQVAYRVARGGIPTIKLNPASRTGKRVVLLTVLQVVAPDLWQAMVSRCQLAGADGT